MYSKASDLIFGIGRPHKNALLEPWLASLVIQKGNEYLQLSRSNVVRKSQACKGYNDHIYPSNGILAWESYKKCISRLLQFEEEIGLSQIPEMDIKGFIPFPVAGSAGLRKTVFRFYLIWRLFPPDGKGIKQTPDTTLEAMKSVDGAEMNYSKVSGGLIHLFPNEDLAQFRCGWVRFTSWNNAWPLSLNGKRETWLFSVEMRQNSMWER